eukprot:5148964-Pleurochrysis_carterae.AAC.1
MDRGSGIRSAVAIAHMSQAKRRRSCAREPARRCKVSDGNDYHAARLPALTPAPWNRTVR